MRNPFEKLVGALRKIHLADSERERMENVLMEYREHLPPRLEKGHVGSRAKAPPSLYVQYIRALRYTAPLLLVVVAVLFGAGGRAPQTTTDVSFVGDVREQESSFKTPPQRASDETYQLGRDFRSGVAEEAPLGSMPEYREDILVEPPIDISDDREFLKIDYSAEIQTRDVAETIRDVEDAVRGVSGRIDATDSTEKWGRVSFVVAKSDFYELRERIAGITYAELYTESALSQNLLPQKQNIEERTDDALDLLLKLEAEKQTLDTGHAARVNTLHTQIASAEKELKAVHDAKELVDEDSDAYAELLRRETLLVQRVAGLKQDEIRENSTYAAKRESLLSQIKSADSDLRNLAEEDTEFINTVETVRGNVYVRWVPLFDLIEAFSPTPMWLNIILLALFLWWYLGRVLKNFSGTPAV